MIKTAEELSLKEWQNSFGKLSYTLTNLKEFPEQNPKLRIYARVCVQPSEEVEYHVHHNECEYYYILSGKGLYRDNEREVVVSAGTVTMTPSGNGHGIRNIGNEMLEFMALVLLD